MPGAPTARPGNAVPSSRTIAACRCSMVASYAKFCVLCNRMLTTAILGASGYAGQETLDRVLAHPELEIVALGSDSLAGSGAAAPGVGLDGPPPGLPPQAPPGRARDRRGGRVRRRRALSLPGEGAGRGVRAARRRGRRRPLGRAPPRGGAL